MAAEEKVSRPCRFCPTGAHGLTGGSTSLRSVVLPTHAAVTLARLGAPNARCLSRTATAFTPCAAQVDVAER